VIKRTDRGRAAGRRAGLATRPAFSKIQATSDSRQRARVLPTLLARPSAIVDLAGSRSRPSPHTARGRPRGAGPFGLVTTFLYRASAAIESCGSEGYLRRWREPRHPRSRSNRSDLVSDLLPRVPSQARGAIATLIDAEDYVCDSRPRSTQPSRPARGAARGQRASCGPHRRAAIRRDRRSAFAAFGSRPSSFCTARSRA